jgi:hypothetical protein
MQAFPMAQSPAHPEPRTSFLRISKSVASATHPSHRKAGRGLSSWAAFFPDAQLP